MCPKNDVEKGKCANELSPSLSSEYLIKIMLIISYALMCAFPVLTMLRASETKNKCL